MVSAFGERIQHNGDCRLDLVALPSVAAHEDGYIRLHEQDACSLYDALAQRGERGDVFVSVAEPVADYDQLAISGLRSCVEGGARVDVGE